MKIDISKIDREHFNVYPRKVGDYTVYLVWSKASARWDKDNLIYRSSVWTENGELISPSFKKFFNWDEQPLIDPKPYSLSNCNLIEKIDGSTFIVSNYKGNLIARTRSSIDTSHCSDITDIDLFKTLYPKAFTVDETYTYLFEWVSPSNKIILKYDKHKLYLIGAINHSDYSMWTQDKLDDLAIKINVERPRVFKFSTIEEMFEATKSLKNIEGFCVYYNHEQTIKKVKTIQYLTLHKFKYNLQFEDILNMFLIYDRPNYNNFISRLTSEFDWECVETIKGSISRICDASKEVDKILKSMKSFADSVKNLPRKDAVNKILAAYSMTNRAFIVIDFLNEPEVNKKNLKKLLIQVAGKA